MAYPIKSKQILVDSNFNVNTHKIINLVDPTDNQDAATKFYVDAVAQGVSPHAPVRVVLTGDTLLSGLLTIDSIILLSGDSALVAGQTDKTENGIYVVSGGTWSRRTDADGDPNSEIELGDFVFVESGSTNAASGWVLGKTNAPTGQTFITTGDTQEWYKMASAVNYTTDGQGIELSGNIISLELDGTTLTKSPSGVKLNDSLNSAISNNTVNISTEISTRSSIDNSLSTGLSTEVSNRISGDVSLSTILSNGLSTEISNRISGDTSLSSDLSTEISNRISGDISLSTILSTEVSTRISVDTVLSSDLSTEISNRISGDTSLSTELSSEASTRLSVDNSLSTAVSNVAPVTGVAGNLAMIGPSGSGLVDSGINAALIYAGL